MSEVGKSALEKEIRLNKYLADCGLCSRREADRLIASGAVAVDGRPACVGEKIGQGQAVFVNGRRAEPQNERVALAVNKPVGVVCTTDKTWGDTTIDEIVRYPKRVFYAGRLDKNSEGLLLMTNDGELQDRMMRAANYHEKEYLVRVTRPFDMKFLEAMARGVYLEELEVQTRPCRVARTGRQEFRIVLTQGLNRQIRRMCAALGYTVESIRRVRVMNITLGDLAPGAYRELTQQEMDGLFRMLEAPRKHPAQAKGSALPEKQSIKRGTTWTR